jgi:AAA+ superfamily predicted ATPase
LNDRLGLSLLPGLAIQLVQEHSNPEALFTPLFQTPAPSTLTLADFPHLASQGEFLVRLIQGAWRSGRAGIHILLHGAPGTGKTEFARALAQSLKANLVEVRSQDADQKPIDGEDRLHAYALCQRALQRQGQSLICFDEVEDVFFEWSPWAPRMSRHKGWTNRLLEEAAVPTIWISNRAEGIDAAYRQRMIYELPFRIPPQSVRRQMLLHHLHGQAVPVDALPESVFAAELQPREVQQVATVLQLIEPQEGERDEIIQKMLTQRGRSPRSQSRIPFDLELIECDQDLPSVIDSLTCMEDARLLLQGPSGTGKTAFVHYLADSLGRELHTRTAAELLGKYVGETEQQIAGAFWQARKDILFLDEADSFLLSREEARNSWEVSMVNEILQQMESFSGILVMATNLRDRLDAAVFRRFDWELHFQPLGMARRLRLLAKLEKMDILTLNEAERQEAARILEGIVPADLSVLQRRYRQQSFPVSQQLLSELREIIDARQRQHRRSIGFTAPCRGKSTEHASRE